MYSLLPCLTVVPAMGYRILIDGAVDGASVDEGCGNEEVKNALGS
jgi:hypothetical protein